MNAMTEYMDIDHEQEELAREARRAGESEASLIHLMLCDNGVFQANQVSQEWFSSTVWRKSYGAIKALVDQRQVADYISVSDYLDGTDPGVNWLATLAELNRNNMARPESVETYVSILRDAHTRRSAERIARRLMAESRKGQAAVDDAIRELMELDTVESSHDHDAKSIVRGAIEYTEEAFERGNNGELVGLPTGLTDLDKATGGWHDTDLVVIPARPAMGKTAMLLNLALNADVPFGIISSEQSHDQMGVRMLSISGRVSGNKIRQGRLQEEDWSKLSAGAQSLMRRNFWINDDATITIDGIRRQARKWFYSHGIKVLFVDYIQRIYPTDPRLPKHQQVADVTTGLKSLAKELGIPVIALAQVNRECEKRDNKRPSMGDIADASIIEKEADMVMTIYRDEVYNPDTADKGIAELGICKNRHGPIGKIRTAWDGATFRFENLAPQYYEEGF
jgi:replicative DNA helicase